LITLTHFANELPLKGMDCPARGFRIYVENIQCSYCGLETLLLFFVGDVLIKDFR